MAKEEKSKVVHCADCRYFVTADKNNGAEPSGACHRFPAHPLKAAGDWCGEGDKA